jgi:hypothetical protein
LLSRRGLERVMLLEDPIGSPISERGLSGTQWRVHRADQ